VYRSFTGNFLPRRREEGRTTVHQRLRRKKKPLELRRFSTVTGAALTETIAEQMRGDIDVFVHHGSVSKGERLAAEERFATGTNACIVATSTLELVIDVGGLDLSISGQRAEHRVVVSSAHGRTGRRPGVDANMTFLCENAVAIVQATALARLAARGWVESAKDERRCWPVLVHQVLASASTSTRFNGVEAIVRRHRGMDRFGRRTSKSPGADLGGRRGRSPRDRLVPRPQRSCGIRPDQPVEFTVSRY